MRRRRVKECGHDELIHFALDDVEELCTGILPPLIIG